MTYRVILFRMNARNRVLHRGLTLEEAQAWCRDPETSSQTSTGVYQHKGGPWFYGYESES